MNSISAQKWYSRPTLEIGLTFRRKSLKKMIIGIIGGIKYVKLEGSLTIKKIEIIFGNLICGGLGIRENLPSLDSMSNFDYKLLERLILALRPPLE